MPTVEANVRKPMVAWVAVEPTPYHLPLFEHIRQTGRVNIEYFFCSNPSDQPWAVEHDARRIATETGGDYRLAGLHFNPSIVRALIGRPWDAVVFSGYAQWTMQAGILICLARRIPFILQSDTHLLRPRHWLKRALKRLFLFPVLRRSAAAIGLGVLQRRYFESIGIDPARLFTVALTPHLDRFRLTDAERSSSRAALRREWGIPDSAVVGLYAGRLVAVKAPDVLLAALERMPAERRPHLVLVGDGPLRADLEAMVRRQALPVHFAGFHQNDELPSLLAAADFFVLPSREEPWGIAVAEAMAAGLPAVLSDQVGAAYDLLELGQNGFLVAAGSAESLEEALERCVRQRDRLPAMGERSRAIVEDWNCETSTREFFRAIDIALGRPQA